MGFGFDNGPYPPEANGFLANSPSEYFTKTI